MSTESLFSDSELPALQPVTPSPDSSPEGSPPRDLSPLDEDRGINEQGSYSEHAPEPQPKLKEVSEGDYIELPGRDPKMPGLYIVNNHPKVPSGKRAIVVLMDTDTKAMLAFDEFLSNMTFPEGTDEGIKSAGFVALEPGDRVLVRSMSGDGNPINDSVQAWVLAADEIDDATHAQWEKMKIEVGGPRDDRTPNKSVLVDGEWREGTKFEKHEQAVHVSTSQRCYTLVHSYQSPRNLVGPTVGAKVAMGQEPSDHQVLRKTIIQAAAPLAIHALESGPPELVSALQLQAEVTNLPPVGFEGNYAFPTMQLNISPTQAADKLAVGAFKTDLGNFGGKHKDERDSDGGVTTMITFSDLDPTDHPGYFILGDFGVAIRQSGLVVACFCGLRWHGGFPPTAQPGKIPEKWAYRFVVVCYPPRAMLDGSALLSFAALPSGRHLYMPPEFIDPLYDDIPVQTNVANWIHSGMYLTSPAGFLQYYYRGICQLAYHLGRQIPEKSQMKIDFKKLAECITLTDSATGIALQPEPWELHPGSTVHSDRFGSTRAEAPQRWEKHKDSQRQYIPHCVRVQEQRKEDEAEKAKKGSRPRATRLSKKKSKSPVKGSREQNAQESSTLNVRSGKRLGKQRATQAVDEEGDLDCNSSDNDEQDSRDKTKTKNGGRRQVPYVELPTLVQARSSGRASSSVPKLDWCDTNEHAEVYAQVNFAALDYIIDDGPESEEQSDSAVEESTSQALVLYQQADSQTESELHTGAQSYTNVLEIFSLKRLSAELTHYQALAAKVVTDRDALLEAEASIDMFLTAFRSDQLSPHFLAALSQMWSLHAVLQQKADLFGLQLSLYRRRVMLSSAAAWFWLMQSCVSRCDEIVQACKNGEVVDENSGDWLERLCCRVYFNLHRRKRGPFYYRAGDFIPHLDDSDICTRVARPSQLEDDISFRVREEVIKLIREWLCFPNNTEMLAAFFVMYVVGTFKTTDVLLLHGVWRTYTEVQARILGTQLKPHRLHKALLDPFYHALLSLPLAVPGSSEATVMLEISAALEVCIPEMRSWGDLFIHSIVGTPLLEPPSTAEKPPRRSSRIPSSSQQSGTSPLEDAVGGSSKGGKNGGSKASKSGGSKVSKSGGSSRSKGQTGQAGEPKKARRTQKRTKKSHADEEEDEDGNESETRLATDLSCPQDVGLKVLVAFALEMLPLVYDEPLTNPTRLQSAALTRLDHFLPWREQAPCRQHVTSVGGPFHPDNLEKPGAFASMVIFRALFFESPKILSKATSCYYATENEWDEFVASQPEGKPADDDFPALDAYFNIHCYGTPTQQRREGMRHIGTYFAHEAEWEALRAAHNRDPIPLQTVFWWLQGKRLPEQRRKRNLPKYFKIPLFGPLTAYLLAADLSYTHMVATPTLTNIAEMISIIQRGSWKALIATGQISEKASVEDIHTGLSRVYNAIWRALGSDQVRSDVGYDPIVLEHLLCKFARTAKTNPTWQKVVKSK